MERNPDAFYGRKVAYFFNSCSPASSNRDFYLGGSFFKQKIGVEFADDRRSEGEVNPILSILYIHVSFPLLSPKRPEWGCETKVPPTCRCLLQSVCFEGNRRRPGLLGEGVQG
jgi:hypothetical protein